MMIHGDSHRLRRITRSTSEMKYKRFVLGWVWRQLTPIEDAEVENKNKLGGGGGGRQPGSHTVALTLPSSASPVQFLLTALIMPIMPVTSSMKKGGEIKEETNEIETSESEEKAFDEGQSSHNN